jgi:sugar lactone lactonase YvrE
MTLKHLRSSTVNKRPQASGMADGQLAINTASGSPGLFFKDAAGNVVKIGPVHVGSGAPNMSPASGGTSGNSIGEQWLDNSGGTYVFKVWDGSAWRSESGEFVNVTGDTMTGSLTMGPAATLIFEGSVDDGFETTLTVANPTADQTITLPNITGTVVTTGDTGTVTSTMIADGTIANADVNASAAIAGTKISPNFGSQNLTSTGTSTAASFIPTSSGAPTNGLYLSAANTVALATNSTGRLFVSSTGRVGLGTASSIAPSAPLDDLHIASTDPAVLLEETDAGVDEKYWRIRADGSILRFEGINDAFNTSTAWLNVTRSTGARTVDNIAFNTGTNERLRIDSSGRLLVGTSSAVALAGGTPSFYIEGTSASTANGAILRTNGASTFSLVRGSSGNNATSTCGTIFFQGYDGSAYGVISSISSAVEGSVSGGSTPGTLIFSTTPSGASSASERLRITSAGLVGIGTSAPATLLHLSSATGSATPTPTELRIATTTNASDWSTTTPWGRFSFYSADASNAGPKTHAVIDAVATSTAGGTSSLRLAVSDITGALIDGLSVTPTASTGLTETTLYTSGNARLHITSAGSVGIGTTTPGNALSVVGYGNATSGWSVGSEDGGTSGYLVSAGSTSNSIELAADPTNAGVNSNLAFSVDGSERARIDSSGRLLVGTSSSRQVGSPSGGIQLEGNDGNAGSLTLVRFSDSSFGNYLTIGKARGTKAAPVISQDNDSIGSIEFASYDGVDLTSRAAGITAFVDGTPDTNDMPGRLVFSTTADGASSPTERMRITSTGRLGLATTAPAALAHVAGDTIISNVDLTSATYDSISFSVAAEEIAPTGLFFSPDGRKMFVLGDSGNDINEYTLSTPWNVSTATYVTVFSVSAQDIAPNDLYFRNDGKKLYVIGSATDAVYQYSLNTPWSIASASYDSISFAVGTQDTAPIGVFLKPDGLTLYILGGANDTVYQYTLSTAWNASTAVLTSSFSVLAQETGVSSISFSADGSRLFIMGTSGDDVNIYNLTTPWDITTASFVTAFSVAAQETSPIGLFVKPDGTKFYIVGTTNDTVYQYSIPSATIDLTGTTNINGNAEIAQDLTVRGGVGFYGTDAIAQPAGTGEATGFTAGTGTAVNDVSTFTGNLGTTAYRINDVVKALKQLGLLKL